MARFIGKVDAGNGRVVSRLGNTKDGLTVTASGHELGVQVDAIATSKNEDVFFIYLTSGNNPAGSRKRIGEVRIGPDGKPYFDNEYTP